MEKVVNCYETMFIVDTSKGETAVEATTEKFLNLVAANAETVDVDKWGKRRLAYAINDLTEGYYVVATFKCDGSFCAELERNFNIDENILRSFVLKLEHEPVKKKAAVVEETATEAVEASTEATAE